MEKEAVFSHAEEMSRKMKLLRLTKQGEVIFIPYEQIGMRTYASLLADLWEIDGLVQTSSLQSYLPLPEVESISLEVGRDLLFLVDPEKETFFVRSLDSLRSKLAFQLGLVVPSIVIKDNLNLPPRSYVIKIKDLVVAQGEIYPAYFFALCSADKLSSLKGINTFDPTYGTSALWIRGIDKGVAEKAGCMVLEPSMVITTQLSHIITKYASELLGLSEVKRMLDYIKESEEELIEDVYPVHLSLSQIRQILSNLLAENVSVRDLRTIFKALSKYAAKIKNTDLLTEFVRMELGPSFTSRYLTDRDELRVFLLDPELEDSILRAVRIFPETTFLDVAPLFAEKFIGAVGKALEYLICQKVTPVILCHLPVIRPYVKKLISSSFPSVEVFSSLEIPFGVNLQLNEKIALKDLPENEKTNLSVVEFLKNNSFCHLLLERKPLLSINPCFIDFGEIDTSTPLLSLKVTLRNLVSGNLTGSVELPLNDWLNISPLVFHVHYQELEVKINPSKMLPGENFTIAKINTNSVNRRINLFVTAVLPEN